ncbi:MAG: hypothetical protein V3T70_07005 [Phycisphaerae bacterium]
MRIELDPPSAPAPAKAVKREFIAHLRGSRRFGDEAVRFVSEHLDGPANRGNEAWLDEALAVLSPEFRRGLDAASEQNFEAALARLSPLAEADDDPYVAVNAAFFAAQALLEEDRVRDTLGLLGAVMERHAPFTRYTTHAAELTFLLAYVQVHMLQYDAAAATLDDFLDHYPDAPERFRVTARQMQLELRRRDPGGLGDVQDLMNFSRRELELRQTDDAVVQRQVEIIELLDRLIEEAQQNEREGEGEGQSEGGGGGRDQRQAQRKQSRGGGPRDQSQLSRGSRAAADRLESARRARPGQAWGAMPPREREQILQSLQKQFPSQYRDLVEQYYRQIAKEDPSS